MFSLNVVQAYQNIQRRKVLDKLQVSGFESKEELQTTLGTLFLDINQTVTWKDTQLHPDFFETKFPHSLLSIALSYSRWREVLWLMELGADLEKVNHTGPDYSNNNWCDYWMKGFNNPALIRIHSQRLSDSFHKTAWAIFSSLLQKDTSLIELWFSSNPLSPTFLSTDHSSAITPLYQWALQNDQEQALIHAFEQAHSEVEKNRLQTLLKPHDSESGSLFSSKPKHRL